MGLFFNDSLDFIALVKDGNYEYVKAVLEGRKWSNKERKALDINMRDKFGYGAIHHACVTGRVDILKVLIAAGVDVNAPALKDDISPLLFTAWKDKTSAALLLLEAGARVNAPQASGTYPLHWAARNGNYELAKALLDSGADINCVNHQGVPAIVFALESRAIRMLELLIDRGARTDIVHTDGSTTLESAQRYNLDGMLRNFVAARPLQVNTDQRETSEWQKLGHQKVAHIENFPQLARKLTTVFNFETRERLLITQNLQTLMETMSPPASFDTLAETELKAALEEFQKQGGIVDQRRVLYRNPKHK